MLEGCSLIATLPNLSRTDKVHKVLINPMITEARFNTGSNQLMNIEEVVSHLKQLSETYSKPIWIDIKGRQLRITKWADPSYEAIELNHNVGITYPAKIYFRNGDCSNIVRTKENKILVDSIPKHALGAGQSVNIIAKDLEIEGYLTDSDIEYLKLCNDYEMNYIMASFVERIEDLSEIQKYHSKALIVSKIESLKGIRLIMEHELNNLMAAREDLYIETGQDIRTLNYLKTIIEKNKNAICASKIFSSLEKGSSIDLSDYSDLKLMYDMGYRRFMLCDNICNYHFDEAIEAWGKVLRR